AQAEGNVRTGRGDRSRRWRRRRATASAATGVRAADRSWHRGNTLPGESFSVSARLQTERAVDPGDATVGKGGPVVELPPDQQTTGGLLQPVAVLGVVPLILATIADDI